ncbi:hypothetical protein D6833_12740, partial [Candidatus Parcubacteria bacterium]
VQSVRFVQSAAKSAEAKALEDAAEKTEKVWDLVESISGTLWNAAARAEGSLQEAFMNPEFAY